MYPAGILGLYPPYISSSYLQPDIVGNLKLYCPFVFVAFPPLVSRTLSSNFSRTSSFMFLGLFPPSCSLSSLVPGFSSPFEDFSLLMFLGLPFLVLWLYPPYFLGLYPGALQWGREWLRGVPGRAAGLTASYADSNQAQIHNSTLGISWNWPIKFKKCYIILARGVMD